MKWVAIILVLITIAAPLAVAVLIDTPTAIFVMVAWSVVCICGGAPVLFSVITRRAERRRTEREEAQEIGEND